MKAWMHRTLLGLALAVATPAIGRPEPAGGVWREAYQSSPADYSFTIPGDLNLPPEAKERLRIRPPVSGTLRSRFAVGVGGSQVRIRISNEEGSTPLELSAASIGLAATGFDAKPGTIRPLSFGGKRRIRIAAGAPVLSDPVDLKVDPSTELVASVHVPAGLQLKPFGGVGMSAGDGDQTLTPAMANATPIIGRPIVTGASVLSTRPVGIVVALGDSITDGNRTQPEILRGWPEQLARRLGGRTSGPRLAVINAGLGGNRVLEPGWGKPALARFDRDVARIDGVSHLIVLEGINDIGTAGKSPFGTSPLLDVADLIGGYRQLIARGHARGMKIIIGTLLPFEGAYYFTPAKEAQRQAVNRWILTSGEPDAVIDFAAVARDPAHPSKLRPGFDSGDHLHPNEAGYRAMADAVDLELFD